ncbi:MAG: NUDIX hydrolase [Thermogemmatispora sp.]|uniref:NUDIX hydrolase n=1 Tax=Thermogemmatispora sp. TaxID=1968838 RepID=UPI002618459A|nr:NUDIX hydrolase [Thermogemmatispora sp.]MBX5459252.1 NUDIX hydrolase [Thermogemmatispora sp.]
MENPEQYFELVQERPDLFANPSGAIITILLGQEEIAQAETSMQEALSAQGVTQEKAREWAQVGVAYHDQYLLVLRDAVRFPDGAIGSYIRLVAPREQTPGVVILPIYQGQILLLRHFRHATRSWHLEIPRGFGWPGCTSEESARRELVEELGAEPLRLVPLGQIHPNTGITAECDELFYAEVATYGTPEKREAIGEILPTPLSLFERLIRENTITDGFTLAAYARARARGLL